MYGKPFPHFDSLDIAFGKDRAIGSAAEDLADMPSEMEREFFQETQGGEETLGGDLGFNFSGDEANFGTQVPETQTYNPTTTQAPNPIDQPTSGATGYRTGKRGGKRVKYNDDDVSERLLTSVNKLGESYAGTMENIQQITSCFLYDKHNAEMIAERKSQIMPMLQELEGLSAIDIVKAHVSLTNNDNLCESFFAMATPELRKAFVFTFLIN